VLEKRDINTPEVSEADLLESHIKPEWLIEQFRHHVLNHPGEKEVEYPHDMTVKDEIERLLKEYGKFKEPWVFVVR
jgi:hypothetical protein